MSVSSHFPGFPFKAPALQAKLPVTRLPFTDSENLDAVPEADVVAVLAHPDDETLMSGTLARLVQSGYSVQLVYVTSGDKGKNLIDGGMATYTLRERELKRALKTLKINRPPMMLRYPDGRTDFDRIPIREDMEMILAQVKPKLVISFGPDGMTGHEDHINVGSAVDAAVKNTPENETLYHMAVTPQALSDADFNEPFHWGLQPSANTPDVRVDVRDVLATKHRAMQKYESQYTKPEAEQVRAWYMRNPYETFAKA